MYIEERRTQGIEFVETTITAFIGGAIDGPVDEPVEVSSVSEFERTFGPVTSTGHLGLSVRDYFANGEGQAVIVRVGASTDITGEDVLGGPHGRIDRRGLYALDGVDVLSIIVVPPYFGTGAVGHRDVERHVLDAVIAYAHERRAFVVADAPAGWASVGHAHREAATALPVTRDAAVYFPRLVHVDQRGKESVVAPSGAVAGIYTRFDALRGVWKAPSGAEASVIGAERFSLSLTEADSERLTPSGINALRTMHGFGNVVWGARTLSGEHDPEYRYVPVRRLLLAIEQSLLAGLEWVVFEPNGPQLWAHIRSLIEDFLFAIWRQGAFPGQNPQESYVVRCGPETSTAADLANGICNVEIGVAPERRAEFIMLRLSLRTAG